MKLHILKDRRIIGIAGKARSGKDTIAEYLVEHHGYRRFAFADPMKKIVNAMFGWDERHSFGDLKEVIDPEWGFSPRKAYQTFGTEFGRTLSEDLWIEIAHRELGPGKWVIPDVRFENEAHFCRLNGAVFHVHRADVVRVNHHISEAGIDIKPQDSVIENNGTLLELYSLVEKEVDFVETCLM
jgi:hypothetical protein